MWSQEYPGFISVLSSLKNVPIDQILSKWDSKVKNGHIKRLTDLDLELPVIQLAGTNIKNNYICIPASPQKSLKIKFPIMVLLTKNLDKYFSFEVTILDNKDIKRIFTSANNQSITRIKPFQCSMPLEMDEGWNQIVFDLADYCEKAFGSKFVEVIKVQIHANTRIARLYFNDIRKNQDQIPADYKLFMRVQAFKI